MSASAEKWIDIGGIKTRYYEAGQGSPIVLVHGGIMGELYAAGSAEDWDANLAGLAQTHRVIALDRLGQGFTANPHNDDDWSMQASVAHLTAFLKAVGAGPCHLVGHSEGGYAALRVALDQPALVSSCVIIDSHTAATNAGRDEFFFALNPHAAGTPDAARALAEQYSLSPDHISEAWLGAKQRIFASDTNRAARSKMDEAGLKATVYLQRLLVDREELVGRLDTRGISRSVLLVWGYNDPVAPVDQSYQLYRMLAKHQSRCQLHILNQAGHFSFRERPAEFNRVLTEFVEGVSDGN
jgi:2-hydroxy-6-oxonona-2,4-dienedioate hydrolase